MSQPMKGLVQFIADLRNARAREAEAKRVNQELANIRQKFRGSSLNGYNKKKYICKLMYMYILGYDVDFGYNESISLIASPKFSEKQIGYLAISLMLNEESKLLEKAVEGMRKDLESLNDLHTCLALNCVATVGTRSMGDSLGDDVFKLLISPTSPNFVRKKAALTLLRLYRKNPEIISQDSSWPDRIVALLDDPDLGVTTSVSSLVVALAQDDADRYKMSYGKTVRRLYSLVFDQAYTPDYVYYEVPCPWLFIKLFKLLQYYPPSQDENMSKTLQKIIRRVIEANATPVKNIQQNNAQNAVLFEVINLAIHLDADPQLRERIAEALGHFLSSSETNVRYLSLSGMANLAARYDQVPIKRYLVTVMQALKDRDISVRRKAVDLLYCLCDSNNVKTIVNELLKYLQAADFAIREETVIRIAVLVEKYATEFKWYVDISLKLLAVAGNHVSEEVWQRVVQIVVNNENLQAYAARTVLEYVKQPSCHENMVKVGAYLLGEYGHLVADEPNNSPIEQFLALHDKFSSCAVATKCLLLTTYVKFVNLFVEIKPQLIQVFEYHSSAIDSELQQRACEYLRLAQHSNTGLLPTVWDEMPPFPERTSALLSRLHHKSAHAEDKRVWVLGNKEAQTERPALHLDQSTVKREEETKAAASPPPPPPARKSSSSTTAVVPPPVSLTSGWETGYRRLLTANEGMFYEDSLVQIGYRSEYRRHLGCVILYFRNVSETILHSLSADVTNLSGEEVMHINTKNFPESSVPPKGLTQQVIVIDAKLPFSEPPIVKITYLAGSLKVVNLKMPITLEKFMEPASLTGDDFFTRWKQLNGENLECQRIFKNTMNNTTNRSVNDDDELMKRLNLGIIPGVDKNENNVVGSSVLHTSVGGNFGCLVRLEPNESNEMYRVTVRATDGRVPAVLAKNITDTYQM